MQLSKRSQLVPDSITLKLNEKAQALADNGHHIYNLTAGQLPFKPDYEFIEILSSQLKFLKSYQYAPVPGNPKLRKKFMDYTAKIRGVRFDNLDEEYDCIISNGGKQSLYNVMGALVNPGDEVVLMAPHWVSYPEMIKFWGGELKVVKGHAFDAFTPSIEELREVVSKKTKLIVINSPNNPSGIHYSEKWMKEFALFLNDFPDLIVVSDEIYYTLNYFDPKPSYFYQFDQSLLNRTIIVDGISKSFACTGLRIGYCIAPKTVTTAISKIQAQTTSGASSLVQNALELYDFDNLDRYLEPIKEHLRTNSITLRETFRAYDLANCWYQTVSAFYYMVDFFQTPVFEKYSNSKSMTHFETPDYAAQICSDLLEQTGIAAVPSSDFGVKNAARISLVLEEVPFREAMEGLAKFLSGKT